MAVNLDACIQCKRCVRACREVQVNDVIGMAGRGHGEKIVFDLDDPMGESTCVACGECVQACPTGALMPATLVDADKIVTGKADRKVDSVCPYCGVGCQLTYQVKDDKIALRRRPERTGQRARLCVKGRFGFDYVHTPHRLTKPLIRKDGVPKIPQDFGRSDEAVDAFSRGDLGRGARPRRRRAEEDPRRDGSKALAGFGSAKGSNEEAYLFQKLVRTGFGTNNVDHCTRLCHASSVAALMEGVSSGAVSATFNECKNAEVIFVIGANPTVNHPVAATFIKNASKARREADRRRSARPGAHAPRHAYPAVQDRHRRGAAQRACCTPSSARSSTTNSTSQTYVEGFKPFCDSIKEFTPEEMAPICGIEARRSARWRGSMRPRQVGDHLLGHGHLAAHPRHRQRALPDRAGADHRPDRSPGHGTASAARTEQRAGRLRRRPDPDVLPGLPVGREAPTRAPLREAVGHEARSGAGAHRRRDHGRGACRRDPRHVHHGREPGDVRPRPRSRPRRRWPSSSISSCRTCFSPKPPLYADVVLPASAWPEKIGTVTNTDRRVQMGRQALPLPGDARQDIWIIQEIANRMGCNWNYADVGEVLPRWRR